jgi:hypothetical protein
MSIRDTVEPVVVEVLQELLPKLIDQKIRELLPSLIRKELAKQIPQHLQPVEKKLKQLRRAAKA